MPRALNTASASSRLVGRIFDLPRALKRGILISYDVSAMLVALWAAFAARLGDYFLPAEPLIFIAAAVSVVAGIATLHVLQIYRLVLRFFDFGTVTRLLAASGVAGVVWLLIIYLTRAQIAVGGLVIMVPRSVSLIYAGFLFLLLFLGRYIMASLLAVGAAPSWDRFGSACTGIVIYGANAAGISLAHSVQSSRKYRLAAFVDDDPALHGQVIAGTRIIAPHALEDLAASEAVHEAFLAMPNATRSERLNAIGRLTNLNLVVKTVPAPEEIVSGRFTVTDVRPINVTDLLRRDPIKPLSVLIRRAAEGQAILITGAGGSIGSEICRQLLAAGPRQLVLLDHSEFGLFTTEQQLMEASAKLRPNTAPEVIPHVGSILDRALLEQIVTDYEVDTIYHSAAYKHVPMMEQNEVVGVENNVLGTLELTQVAFEAKVDRFIMISTDKAVRPQSVMGASKRAAELIVQAYAATQGCTTKFGIVRFGNVLDSSGSVVQLFRKQIEQGGPVTVTHEDITRFFMSIPEATQLVLQASAMARRGEVFVLDMGEPIRIVELARNMITLSGMSVRDDANPNGDIEITYVGLRPGEKLHEELFVGDEVVATEHPRIRMATEKHLPLDELGPHLKRIRAAVQSRAPAEVRNSVRELVDMDQGHVTGNVTELRRA
jgi:UDP-N-acetylglucosamine 4,6-dehydratase